MEKNYFKLITILAMFIVTSCGTITYDEEQTSDEMETNVTSKNTRQVEFSVNDITDTLSVSRAESTVLSERFTYLHYWIYDSEYKKILASGTQTTSTTNDFGKFSAILAYGTYHVVVVGHNQNNAMALNNENGMVELNSADNRNTDTYYGNTEFEVTKNSTSATVTLNRNMCLVIVSSNGKLSNVGTIDVSLSAYGSAFYANNGFSKDKSSTNNIELVISDYLRTKSGLDIYLYFPLPKAETVYDNVSVSLTSKDTDRKEIKSVTINEIPAKIGRKIKYVGSLWGETSNISVEVSDTEWEKVDDKTY